MGVDSSVSVSIFLFVWSPPSPPPPPLDADDLFIIRARPNTKKRILLDSVQCLFDFCTVGSAYCGHFGFHTEPTITGVVCSAGSEATAGGGGLAVFLEAGGGTETVVLVLERHLAGHVGGAEEAARQDGRRDAGAGRVRHQPALGGQRPLLAVAQLRLFSPNESHSAQLSQFHQIG